MVERLPIDGVRVGPAYEADRVAALGRLAALAGARRVALGPDLVLVFETDETVRAALEELLRAERIEADEKVAAERTAFAAVLGAENDVVATLYVDAADPVALAVRCAELEGVERAVSLEVGGGRSVARPDPADNGSGAYRLAFALDAAQREALASGAPASVHVEHPACRAVATLTGAQAAAVGAGLTR